MRKKFIFCGAVGWCLEIFWTGLHSLLSGSGTLMGHTSLWMFPIYGCAAVISPLSKLYHRCPSVIRGLIYMLHIFFGEYFFGSILKKFQICPWDYSASKYQIDGLIRLDYAPVWFTTGLLYERLLTKKRP
ncbi:MAG: hypothetical protein ACI4DV_06000 [Lachnospiraceae bacterium]